MDPNTPPAPAFEKTQRLIVVEEWWMSLAKPENVRTIREKKCETNIFPLKRKTDYHQNTSIQNKNTQKQQSKIINHN